MLPQAINITVRVDAAAIAAKLGALAGPRLAEALRDGLREGLEYFVGAVQIEARAKGLHSRSGMLLDAVRGALVDGEEPKAFVGVPEESPAARYAWLLTDAKFTITPNGHPYLAIPVGGNLSGAGVAKYSSPRQVEGLVFRRGHAVELGERIFTGLTAGVMVGMEYVPFFALVRKVNARGRDVYARALETVLGDMVGAVQDRVDGLLRE